MEDIKIKLRFISLAISVITVGVGASEVNALFPFDQFMTSKTNETANQSFEDQFKNKLPGEHGQSPNEDLE